MQIKPGANCCPSFSNGEIHRHNNIYSIAYSGDGEPSNEAHPTEPVLPKTACGFCKNDFPGITLNKLSVYNICDSCKADLDNKILPLWVKLFLAGVLALVAFSVFWNWRFYEGYTNIHNANEAFRANRYGNAAYLMTKASHEVPEAPVVTSLAGYYSGINLLNKDRSIEALAQFNKCKDMPADFHVNEFVLQAEMGSGFDKKDYQLFLSAAKAHLQTDTSIAQSYADVASAYACLYVQNNADSLKQQSLKYLGRAKAKDDTSAGAKEFYGRISYRIDARQVIGKAEYDKKFPNGYTSK